MFIHFAHDDILGYLGGISRSWLSIRPKPWPFCSHGRLDRTPLRRPQLAATLLPSTSYLVNDDDDTYLVALTMLGWTRL